MGQVLHSLPIIQKRTAGRMHSSWYPPVSCLCTGTDGEVFPIAIEACFSKVALLIPYAVLIKVNPLIEVFDVSIKS